MAVKALPHKDPAAVALGRKGGQKGGAARAAKLTADERSEIARSAVRARWDKANRKREGTQAEKTPKKNSRTTKGVNASTSPNNSDRAVLALLERIKAADDAAEIRTLTTELERLIFHKQYKTA